jgi:hypothetical protein
MRGRESLAAVKTLSAEACLRKGLTLEVKKMPEFIADACSGHELATKDRRQLPAAERVLKQKVFHLLDCRTVQSQRVALPQASLSSNLPSNSQHLPRAGGGKQRRLARDNFTQPQKKHKLHTINQWF